MKFNLPGKIEYCGVSEQMLSFVHSLAGKGSVIELLLFLADVNNIAAGLRAIISYSLMMHHFSQ